MKTLVFSICLALFACQSMEAQALLRRDFPVGDRMSDLELAPFTAETG
jgi:hypothetical protein